MDDQSVESEESICVLLSIRLKQQNILQKVFQLSNEPDDDIKEHESRVSQKSMIPAK